MQILITQEELSKMRDNAITNNILSDEKKDEFEERFEKSKQNYVSFARLYIDCITLLKEKKDEYAGDDATTYLNWSKIIESYETAEIRNLIHKFDINKTLGNYYARLDIEDYIKNNLEDIDYIMRMFFKIFGKEELY